MKTYKVWVEVEEYDDETEEGQTLDSPGASVAQFDSYDEAYEFADKLQTYGEETGQEEMAWLRANTKDGRMRPDIGDTAIRGHHGRLTIERKRAMKLFFDWHGDDNVSHKEQRDYAVRLWARLEEEAAVVPAVPLVALLKEWLAINAEPISGQAFNDMLVNLERVTRTAIAEAESK